MPFMLLSNTIMIIFFFYQMPTVFKSCRHVCQLLMYACEAPVPKSPLVFDHTFSCISFVSFISISPAAQRSGWKNTNGHVCDFKESFDGSRMPASAVLGTIFAIKRRKCCDLSCSPLPPLTPRLFLLWNLTNFVQPRVLFLHLPTATRVGF